MAICAERKHLYHRNTNRLSRRVREFIVVQLGSFVSEREIVRQVREVFDIEISQPAVHHYTTSPVWGPEVRGLRQELREQLELRYRLASPVARISELCQAAERYQERLDRFRQQLAAVLSERERLRRQQREAQAGRHGIAPVSPDVFARLECQVRDLMHLVETQERLWYQALAGIRNELRLNQGLEEGRDDGDEAAEFIRQLTARLAQERKAGVRLG